MNIGYPAFMPFSLEHLGNMSKPAPKKEAGFDIMSDEACPLLFLYTVRHFAEQLGHFQLL